MWWHIPIVLGDPEADARGQKAEGLPKLQRETLSQQEIRNKQQQKGQTLYFSGKVFFAKYKALGTMVGTAKKHKTKQTQIDFYPRA